ncbi:hypothetical protein TNCT_524541 [Trichonephila clavata]|uniref:Uncharacterized protein n=1 Tax=Trichonephila clavata TaxID=2740835 RepID=A0A8X6F6F4_TRICU|nr:hypothetical protein TNCT_524541 [Trichonephila clavata]
MKNTRFWHGPHWLTLSEKNWPKNERLSLETTNEERKVKYISINYSSELQNEEPILDINDFISISKITAPLPRDRIEQSPPFAVTGLDFAGPIFVKNSKEKFYKYTTLHMCCN